MVTRGRGRLALAALAVLVTAGGAARASAQDRADVAAAIRRAITAPDTAAGRIRPASQVNALSQLYERGNLALIWTAGGRPTRQALASLEVLRQAASLGLEPSDYDADALAADASRLADSTTGDQTNDVAALARFDVGLSRSVLRLIVHLSVGRVDPRSLGFALPRPDTLDLAGIALGVGRAADARAAILAAEPPYVGYAALERMLARYRVLAADSTLRPPPRPRGTLRPGDAYDGALALRRLLAALGDLPPAASSADSADETHYTPDLVDAVEAFQRRHGLDADGIVGPATMAQLRVPLAQRVVQIELTLERWRWLPHHPPDRYLVVNIPGFHLYAFEHDPTAAHPELDMKVILGRTQGRRATPVFVGTMRQVVFRPYWDVPLSIARGELVPLMRSRPGYAAQQSLEIVRGGDTDATIYPVTAANLARVESGALRLRQRPGPDNALGPVKFVFPNAHNVYLHGTPEQELFARARRDFSHGCIRVEDPAALAALVLRGQAGWDRAAIDSAMHGTRTRRVTLQRPVEVFILYATAVVDWNGVISFYPDLYGHDAALARTLARAASR